MNASNMFGDNMSYEMKLNDIWRYFSNMFHATDRVGSKTFTPRVLETIQPGVDVWPYLCGQHYISRLEALDLDPNPQAILNCEPDYWYIILGGLANVTLADPAVYAQSPTDEIIYNVFSLGDESDGACLFQSSNTTVQSSPFIIHDGSFGNLYVKAEVGKDDVDVVLYYIKIRKPMPIIERSTA